MPHLLEGPCQVECANVSSLLGFKNSHWIREELTLPIIQNKIKSSLPTRKIVLIRSHQFVRVLNTAYTACNFQFFPWLPVKSSTLPPSTQAKIPGRAGKKSQSAAVSQDTQIAESGFLGKRGRGWKDRTIKLQWKMSGTGGMKAATLGCTGRRQPGSWHNSPAKKGKNHQSISPPKNKSNIL